MSGGIGAAVSEAMEGEEVEIAQAVQAALFDDLTAEETGDLDAPSPFSQTLKVKSGPGRRKGSRNVRTSETLRWILSQHRHPLSVICEAYSMSPAEFAAKIGLPMPMVEVYGKDHEGKRVWVRDEPAKAYDTGTLLEIAKLQLRMAEAALPYLAQKQPMAVQLEGKAQLSVSFEGVSLPARGGPGLGSMGAVVEGMAVALPFKSDDPSRTAD